LKTGFVVAGVFFDYACALNSSALSPMEGNSNQLQFTEQSCIVPSF
jgi:hypothetical protein